jgi:hypothetical protein
LSFEEDQDQKTENSLEDNGISIVDDAEEDMELDSADAE